MNKLEEYIEKTVLEQERDLRKRLSALYAEQYGYGIYRAYQELDEVLALCQIAMKSGSLEIGRILDIFYNVEDFLLRCRNLMLF